MKWLYLFFWSGLVFAKESVLTLETVLKSVDTCFPQIMIARNQITQAKGQLISTYGKFDPQLNTTTRALPFGGYVSNYVDTEVLLPTYINGIKVYGGYRNGIGDWPIYYQNYLTNTGGEYRAGISLPVLRNRKLDNERLDVLAQRENLNISADQLQATKIRVYQEAILVYWNWVQMGHQLDIFKDLLHLAEVRQEAIKKQAHQGDLPLLAITENQQWIVQRQQMVKQGELMFRQAANDLALYYRDSHGQPKIPLPDSLPETVNSSLKIDYQFIMMIQDRMNQHPELRRLKKLYKITHLKKDLAKNDMMPFLDLNAFTSKQYGTNGYPRLIPQAGFIGMTFRFPTFQREAKGRYISATSELRQIKNESQFRFETLMLRLQNLIIGFNISQKQIKLFTQEYDLAKKVEEGERVRFFNGDSSLFLVNQRETTTTQVQINLLNAKIMFNRIKYQIKYYLNKPYLFDCASSEQKVLNLRDAVGLRLRN
jgi:outer membrane protein TolC